MKQALRHVLGAITALVAGFTTSGCTNSDTTATVFAAASLAPVGEELTAAFTQEHPGADIVFNFAGSSALLRQIGEGAPSDLFISADIATMDSALKLAEFAGSDTTVIATNRLVLVTADGNPGGITELAHITDNLIARCAPEVPCGTLTGQALAHAGVQPGTSSEEANVAAVSTKIATGAVDAGFVYSSDAQSLAHTQDNVIIELAGIEPNEYPMSLTSSGRDNEVARAFAGFLSSPRARDILANHGFHTN